MLRYNVEYLRVRALLGTLVFLLAVAASASDPPRVAVSIAPVHSWVSQVSGDLWEPELLLSAQVDPHNALLRPSQRRLVEEADWVIWLGPQLETGLEALVRRVDESRRWTLTDSSADLVTHEFREAGTLFATPENGHDHGHGLDIDFPGAEDASPSAHSGVDPHLWLNPDNARRALRYIADHLGQLDPDNAQIYRQNADRAIEQLETDTAAWEARLAEQTVLPYVVFHDGYQYFDRYFGIPFAGSVTLNPEQLPGLRTINEMRQAMEGEAVGCLFAEVQYPDRLVQAIGSGFGLEIQRIDALGADIEPGPAHYRTMMTRLVDSFAGCN